MYLLALTWLFFGIAVIGNVQMAGIEIMTAARHRVHAKRGGEWFTMHVLVWNATVANLLLLALGSSAPGIMIVIIDTVTSLGNKASLASTLGPSSVVGMQLC